MWLPLQRPAFRRLLLVFVLNGIASAVPATLVLFFVQDRLQAPAGTEPLFLLAYFVCAALSIPLWLRLVRAIGLARSWLTGILKNKLVDLIRDRARYHEMDADTEDDEALQFECAAARPDELAEHRERLALTLARIEQLPQGLRDVMQWRVLHDEATVDVVAQAVREHPNLPTVLDPVMVATSGSDLIASDAVRTLRRELFPLAEVITPNRHEAEVLSGLHISGRADMSAAARAIAADCGCAVLLKGGHLAGPGEVVDILADADGTVFHLYERDCSVQRRHQKVVAEAPSPLLDEATRARIGAAACETARSVGYVGAGTVEFIVPGAAPDEFFFMELNTRLPVEPPVTALVTRPDLV